MEFKVIDKRTGREVSDTVIDEICKNNPQLIPCDIEEFAVTESGQLILIDDCGNVAYINDDNLEVIIL